MSKELLVQEGTPRKFGNDCFTALHALEKWRLVAIIWIGEIL
jgi:hypothetical protein